MVKQSGRRSGMCVFFKCGSLDLLPDYRVTEARCSRLDSAKMQQREQTSATPGRPASDVRENSFPQGSPFWPQPRSVDGSRELSECRSVTGLLSHHQFESGIGETNLPSQAYNTHNTEHEFPVSDGLVVSKNIVDDIRTTVCH
jgi:hypothetical protein